MGPLAGIRMVELGAVGPAPFCAMLLADLGADIVRIDRIVPSDSGVALEPRFDLLRRGRRSIAMDLKRPEAVAAALRLVERSDALIEGFRPGVAERLRLGPEDCAKVNPRLVYGRMTGWGQSGPLAQVPGHDINYIALSGVLHAIGSKDGPPVPPLNLAGDFGGGSLYLALGIVSALLEAKASGRGQVIDAAMVDGSASLMTLVYGMRAAGKWLDQRGSNRLDSGAPWYGVYETLDRRYVALGSNEPRFYRETLVLLGLEGDDLPDQHDEAGWPRLRARFEEVFRQRTRDEWCVLAERREICLSPVLSLDEAPLHPHARSRGTFVDVEGVCQPAPAPRFSRSEPETPRASPWIGEHTDEVLIDLGLDGVDISALRAVGAIS